MSNHDVSRRITDPLKRALNQVLSASDVDNVQGNVAGRTNVVVAHNVAGEGSVHSTSTSHSRIVQENSETLVDESTSENSDSGKTVGRV